MTPYQTRAFTRYDEKKGGGVTLPLTAERGVIPEKGEGGKKPPCVVNQGRGRKSFGGKGRRQW